MPIYQRKHLTNNDIQSNIISALQNTVKYPDIDNPFVTKNELQKPIADYVVSNETELDDALEQIETQNKGGIIFLKSGEYDKGSAFVLPNVSNITLIGDTNATIIRPDGDMALKIPEWEAERKLKIYNLIFKGKGYEEYPLIGTDDDITTYSGSYIYFINCVFLNNYYHWINIVPNKLFILNNIFDNGFSGNEINISPDSSCITSPLNWVGQTYIKDNQFFLSGDENFVAKIISLSGLGYGHFIFSNNYIHFHTVNTMGSFIDFTFDDSNSSYFEFKNNTFNNTISTEIVTNYLIYLTNSENKSGIIKNNDIYKVCRKNKFINVDFNDSYHSEFIFEHNNIIEV